MFPNVALLDITPDTGAVLKQVARNGEGASRQRRGGAHPHSAARQKEEVNARLRQGSLARLCCPRTDVPRNMGGWVFPEVAPGSAPSPRGGHAATALDHSRILVFGGSDCEPKPFADTWLLETGDEYRWRHVKSAGAEREQLVGLSGATLTTVGDKVYLFGGQEPLTGRVHDDVWELDTETWQWSQVKVSSKPPARHSHCAGLLHNDSLLVFGGANQETAVLGDVWMFSVQEHSWYQVDVSGTTFCPREMHSGVMVDMDTMLIYGGRGFANRVMCDASLLDCKMMQWRLTANTPFQRCAHAAATLGAHSIPNGDRGSGACPAACSVIVHGGFTGEIVESDIICIDAETLSAKLVCNGHHGEKDKKIPESRFAHTGISLGMAEAEQGMVVFGGVNAEAAHNDVAVWTM
ncbi:unnamed protein product [Ostreobium quekettii]|uniref:Uncharacterized protein n=1 Tax=Ostreobium quekettii TaxID=121088 RepID=A0A8S1J8T7_9CHLO|nr:unnamed protein product [Ostreobium quekettii]|eukprot:evm.model.scf_97.8 EVM.evm.TU.scf_97.8   scf_97:116860-123922(+)